MISFMLLITWAKLLYNSCHWLHRPKAKQKREKTLGIGYRIIKLPKHTLTNVNYWLMKVAFVVKCYHNPWSTFLDIVLLITFFYIGHILILECFLYWTCHPESNVFYACNLCNLEWESPRRQKPCVWMTQPPNPSSWRVKNGYIPHHPLIWHHGPPWTQPGPTSPPPPEPLNPIPLLTLKPWNHLLRMGSRTTIQQSPV